MRSKIMVLLFCVVGTGTLLGCGPEPATEYDFSWLKYQKTEELNQGKDILGVFASQVYKNSKLAVGETHMTDINNLPPEKIDQVYNVCLNYYAKNFDILETGVKDNPSLVKALVKEEDAFNAKCNAVSDRYYNLDMGTVDSALKIDTGNEEFGVLEQAMEGDEPSTDGDITIQGLAIPELGVVWAKATLDMTAVQQGIAGAIDVVGGIAQGVTNRMLCLVELSTRVLPEISQGLLDDYGTSSAEGACKLSCTTTVTLNAALWCMAYPEDFGNNSEFDPDTLWQEIDSYLRATCSDISAEHGCVY